MADKQTAGAQGERGVVNAAIPKCCFTAQNVKSMKAYSWTNHHAYIPEVGESWKLMEPVNLGAKGVGVSSG